MKIALVANDGSPIGVTPPDIYGRGVGGAELAMMTLMETFAERGHEVEVFNDPRSAVEYNGVKYKIRKTFNETEARDCVIVFRSPNPLVTHRSAATKTIWWSCDQYTVGDFAMLGRRVDHVVVISDFHKHYHKIHYGLPMENMFTIDLGVKLKDYDIEVEKIPGRMIFCSIPDRGLDVLLAAWPQIKSEAPNASLIITSDYRLWGSSANNARYRLMWAGQPDVQFVGAIPRHDLVKRQLEAEIHAYPCVYDELFCISAAECQVAGAIPVTSDWGALPTTNQFGLVMPGNPRSPEFVQAFAKRIAGLVTQERDYAQVKREQMVMKARQRFDWHQIAEKWEKLIYEGKIK